MPHVYVTNNDSTKNNLMFSAALENCLLLRFCEFSNYKILQVDREDHSEKNELLFYI